MSFEDRQYSYLKKRIDSLSDINKFNMFTQALDLLVDSIVSDQHLEEHKQELLEIKEKSDNIRQKILDNFQRSLDEIQATFEESIKIETKDGDMETTS